MDYSVSFDALDRVSEQIESRIEIWKNVISRAKKRIEALLADDSFKGNTADRLHEYLRTVHLPILSAFEELVATFEGSWLSYKAQIQSLDSDLHAVLVTSDMERIQRETSIDTSISGDLVQRIQAAVDDVSDIASFWLNDMSWLEESHSKAINKLITFEELIDSVEQSFVSSRFGVIEEAVHTLRSTISGNLGQSSIYRKNFQASTYSESAEFATLNSSISSLSQELSYRHEEFVQASAASFQRIEQLTAEEEMLRRQKEAEIFKFAVGTLCLVGGVVITAGTIWAGPTVASTASQAITGFIKSGADELAEQYVQNDWYGIDWSEVGTEATVGGVKGFIKGVVGAGFEPLSEGGGFLVKGVFGSVENSITGGLIRFISTGVETNDLGQAIESAFDLNEVGWDVTIGFCKDSSKTFISDFGQGLGIDKLYAKGAGSTGGGMTERYIEQYRKRIEQYIPGEMDDDDIADPGKMGYDFAKGFFKALGKSIASENG